MFPVFDCVIFLPRIGIKGFFSLFCRSRDFGFLSMVTKLQVLVNDSSLVSLLFLHTFCRCIAEVLRFKVYNLCISLKSAKCLCRI